MPTHTLLSSCSLSPPKTTEPKMLIVIIRLCLVWNKSILDSLDSNFGPILLRKTVILLFAPLHLHIAIRIFHNTSATVVHISDSILGSKFWLVLKKTHHWLEQSCMLQGYIPLPALIEL